jgi:hypothetical protein
MPSAAFQDMLTDTLYVVYGAAVVPLAAGPAEAAVWRSRTFVYPSPVSFAWGKVQGQPESGVVLRLYADDALVYTTPSITSREPFRVPPVRARRWAIEVESADRITGVRLAQASEELP